MNIGDLVLPIMFAGRCSGWTGEAVPTSIGERHSVNIQQEKLGIDVGLSMTSSNHDFIGSGGWCRVLFSTGVAFWMTRERLRVVVADEAG